MFEWGSIFVNNPEKRKYLTHIFPDNENYLFQVLSCQILKESDRHGETDLIAEVKVNACTPDQVYEFIDNFEESSFTTLNINRGDKTINGPKTAMHAERVCQHNVKEKSKKTNNQEQGKQTKCPSKYSFKLSQCKKRALGDKKENKCCKCLSFKLTNTHNHIVEGGDSSKWHKVRPETKNQFENYFKRKLSPPQAIVEHEKVMINKHGEQEWYAMSADRSICPDKKYVDNLWSRLHLSEKGTLNGPDSFVRASQWVDDYNKKHRREIALVKQREINGRMEMYACVVDPFQARAHKILQQAGDIVAVDATSSLDLQDTKLVRFVTCSPAGGIPLGYILVSHENEKTLETAFQDFKSILPEHAWKNRGPDRGPVSFLTDDCE